MTKKQYAANIVVMLLMPILLPLFFLLSACAERRTDTFDYAKACHGDCGGEIPVNLAPVNTDPETQIPWQ